MKSTSLIILILMLAALPCIAQTEQDTLIVPTVIINNDAPVNSLDTITQVKSTNIPDSVYIKRLSQLPYEFELTYNPVVRKYIDLFTVKMKSRFEVILGMSEFYFPIFDKILQDNGLPVELRYIPVIESALNPRAVSSAYAVGLWQFIRTTGRDNGLHINGYVDERRAITESTIAAARYLKRLYAIYNDWPLVLAAYNCGPGNVNRAIYRSGGKRDFWEIYRYLPRETRGYVPQFIAVAYAHNYYKEHEIVPVPAAFPPLIDSVTIKKNLHLMQVSQVLGIDIKTLRLINPQYMKDYIPGTEKTSYGLTIPLEFKCRFLELQDSVFAYKSTYYQNLSKTFAPDEHGRIVHVVRSGECLSVIADRYNVSINKLKRWNNIKGTMIRKGQRLVIFES
jgi:membrane-bound lytic murein transglycosylase D